jgi:diguanylate cyclase (GGDEF)-like protein
MISLKRSIEADQLCRELETKEQLLHTALSAYKSAIEAVREHALRASPPLASVYAPGLMELLQELGECPDQSHLERSKGNLLDELSRFGEEAARDYCSMATDIQEIIELAISATDSLETKAGRDSSEIRKFAVTLEAISSLENVSELRRRLRAEVQHIHDCLQQMARDDAVIIRRLHSEVSALREKLQHADQSAGIDATTQLHNRKGLEARAKERADSGKGFCVFYFCIDRFQGIIDRYGSISGNAVLCEFAHRLTANIRATDVAGRWGDDDFVAILDCTLQDALPRSRHLALNVAGTFNLKVQGRGVRCQVSVSTGIAEHRAGLTMDELVARTGVPSARTKPV